MPKRRASGGSGTPKNKKTKGKENSFLHQTFKDIGLVLGDGESVDRLNVKPSQFVRDLVKLLKSDPNMTEKLGKEFSEYLQEKERLKFSLLPITNESGVRLKDSLIRLLLNNNSFQKTIMKIFFEKFIDVVALEEEYKCKDVHIPRLMLSALRWLEYLEDGDWMSDNVMDVLQLSSTETQKDVINALPDILTEHYHSKIANTLSLLLSEKQNLTPIILDAFDNLHLPPEQTNEVRENVVQTVRGTKIEYLPVTMKFILNSTKEFSSAQLNNFIIGLRKKLDIKDLNASERNDNMYFDLLTLDNMRIAFSLNSRLQDAWLKALDGIKCQTEFSSTDLLVLLSLHCLDTRKERVHQVFRKKVRSGLLTEGLVTNTLMNFKQPVISYLTDFLEIAKVLFRAPELIISSFGAHMFKSVVSEFGKVDRCLWALGDIVTTLIQMSSAGSSQALNTLAELIHLHSSLMSPYANFLSGLLEIEICSRLRISQLRTVLDMLSVLGHNESDARPQLKDQLLMVVRKYVTHYQTRFVKIGVVGALMVVKSMAAIEKNHEEAYQLLDFCNDKIESNPAAVGLFLDQLAHIVVKNHLPTSLQKRITEQMKEKFNEEFVVFWGSENIPSDAIVPVACRYAIDDQDYDDDDDDDSARIAVSLTPLLIKQEKAVSIIPHFRLLGACEQSLGNDMTEINALLGCPIYLVSSECLEHFNTFSDEGKQLILSSLFLCVNWFIELLNVFTVSVDKELKIKIVKRLFHLVELLEDVKKLVPNHPTFAPDAVHFHVEIQPPTLQEKPEKGPKKKLGRKGKKKKEKAPSSQDESRLESQPDCQEKDNEERDLDMTLYKPFTRELTMDVFNILQWGVSESSDSPLWLEPRCLEYLLNDLCEKLDHSLIRSSVSGKGSHLVKHAPANDALYEQLDMLSPGTVAKKFVKMLPSLCHYVTTISRFFQDLLSDCDGIEDSVAMRTPQAVKQMSCYNLILQCILNLLTWKGLKDLKYRPVLKECLAVIARQLKVSGSQRITAHVVTTELLKRGVAWLSELGSCAPGIDVATKLLTLAKTLHSIKPATTNTNKIFDMTKTFLKKSWTGVENSKSKAYKEQVGLMLQTYLETADDTVLLLKELSDQVFPEIATGKDACSQKYPAITKSILLILYRCLWNGLLDLSKELTSPAGTDQARQVQLQGWETVVSIFSSIMIVSKNQLSKNALVSLIKNSTVLIEMLVKTGVPLMEIAFRNHKEDITRLIKKLQIQTKFLQNVCLHAKRENDSVMAAKVPPLKRALETFIVRVKALFSLHNVSNAFWMGHLKNRDLHGNIIAAESMDSTTTTDDEKERQEGDASGVEDSGTSDDQDESDSSSSSRDEDQGGTNLSESF